MAIEIDRHDTERLIREISAETGESPDELIHRLVLEEARQRRPAIGSPEYEARKRALLPNLMLGRCLMVEIGARLKPNSMMSMVSLLADYRLHRIESVFA
jgi:hypothetical protein